MTCEEYVKLYGKDACWFIGEREERKPNRPRIIVDGMLEFSEDTAFLWAGPFSRLYAFFSFRDWRGTTHWNGKGSYLAGTDAGLAKKLATLKPPTSYQYSDKMSENDAMITHYTNEYPTESMPFQLYMAGNDDASYCRNFATEEEGLEFIALLEACQPLDAFKDIQRCFAFTN